MERRSAPVAPEIPADVACRAVPQCAEAGEQIGAETFQTGFSHFRTYVLRPAFGTDYRSLRGRFFGQQGRGPLVVVVCYDDLYGQRRNSPGERHVVVGVLVQDESLYPFAFESLPDDLSFEQAAAP